ncbi:MAG: VOC family protein [Candidatus Eiseniibacteriota bacterium]
MDDRETNGRAAAPGEQEPTRLTHAAFQVTDVERAVAFYRHYTSLEVVHERPDSRTGSKVVWLREPGAPPGFTLVLFKAGDKAGDRIASTAPRSLHHLGFALESRAAVDAVADRARRDGVLSIEPADHGEVVGYLCTLADPDGNEIEFSYGQEL